MRRLPQVPAGRQEEPLPEALEGRAMTPLQAELLEEGRMPERDLLGADLSRPDRAPEAGYCEDGPAPLAGPGGQRPREGTGTVWRGEPPVLQ